MRKTALVLIAAGAFLGAMGCKSSTGPAVDSFIGTWRATKAEYVSIANPSTKNDIIAHASTLTLVFSANTFVMTITDPGTNPVISNGTWSASLDTLTLTWQTGYSGESQFDFALNGDNLTLTGGHLPCAFTPGNPEDATLNIILVRQ
jgi:hypothetical protein